MYVCVSVCAYLYTYTFAYKKQHLYDKNQKFHLQPLTKQPTDRRTASPERPKHPKKRHRNNISNSMEYISISGI